MTRLLIGSLSLVLLAAPRLHAQSQPVQVRLATGTFLYDEDRSLLEVYVSFGARSLTYQPSADSTSFVAHVPVRLRVQAPAPVVEGNERPAPVVDEALDFRFAVDDPSRLGEGQVFVEQVRLALAPGEYEVVATLSAPEGASWSAFEIVSDVAVPAYGQGADAAISAIQLATRIEPAESREVAFAKSGLQVIPNPDAFYGGALASVPFYAEVYRAAASGAPYTLLAYLSETNQPVPVASTQRRLERTARPVDVVVDQIDVSTLPSGAYFLRLVVLNEANESVAEQSRRLFVINPDVQRPSEALVELDYEDALYAVMGEEELNLNLRHARILSSAREAARISDLATDEEKRTFLATFWRQRRTDTNPRSNDARRVFYERLGVVNSRYSQSGLTGFESDRGRIYLVYGPPTEVDRRSVESEGVPYEIWSYDNIPGEGRAMFVFADRLRISRLELIHSDVTGEISLPNWQNTIRQ
jgi:GWxTD domain-containing protein